MIIGNGLKKEIRGNRYTHNNPLYVSTLEGYFNKNQNNQYGIKIND